MHRKSWELAKDAKQGRASVLRPARSLGGEHSQHDGSCPRDNTLALTQRCIKLDGFSSVVVSQPMQPHSWSWLLTHFPWTGQVALHVAMHHMNDAS